MNSNDFESPPEELLPPPNGHHPNEPDPIRSFDHPMRGLPPNSLLTAILLLRRDQRNVLEGKALRKNSMTGALELGGRIVTDEDAIRILARIEMLYATGVNKRSGLEIGMKLTKSQVTDAIAVVAAENIYHPVEDYLRGLEWDHVPRLASVCDDILGADRTELNQTLVAKWFLSAVARIFVPGCKVDTALILVGKQGIGKSTFFREIASPWYIETNIDLQNKDSFQILRRGWVVEWAELETMRRAKDVAAVKAFLSTLWDVYRPPYGRFPEEVPRGCVIVGTTNNEEFLTDDTGNRRFWPLTVGATNISLVARQRDQLWAEAVDLYQRGEHWWLTEAESAPLADIHSKHETTDPWAPVILTWVDSQATNFGTVDILEKALEKRTGDWTPADCHRVARVMRSAGWAQGTKLKHGHRPWIQKPVGPFSGVETAN